MSHTPARGLVKLGIIAISLFAFACADQNPGAVAPFEGGLSNAGSELEPAPSAPPSQYIVIFKDGAQGLADESNSSGAKLGDMRYTNAAVYGNVSNPDALAADANVAAVVENFLSYPSAPYPVGAQYYANKWQWDMQQIKANQVPETVQGQGARVCIIDSGLDGTHQDLAGKLIMHTSFVDIAHGYVGPGPSPAPLDSNGHGTHVAGTVSTNGIGTASVAPRAELMSAKVFPATGGASLAAIWDAIDWCTLNNADAINMSLGGQRTRPLSVANQGFRATYEAKILAARSNGAVVVVASGNDNLNMDPASTQETWPAQVAGTVTVGATRPNVTTFPFVTQAPHSSYDTRATYSNYGVDTDIWAPGGANFINRPQANIISTCSSFRNGNMCRGGKYYWAIAGTSMASPHVAGVVALITSRSTAPRGLARTQAIEACLYNTGDMVVVAEPSPPVAAPRTPARPRLNALRAATEPCPGI